MIRRNLAGPLRNLAELYPVVTVTGPRQSGKTTLCRATFPEKAYVSLEPLDERDFARTDPRGFLQLYADGAVIDEVQHAPGLLSYLQTEVDARPTPGRFILTGSQNIGLVQTVSRALTGRTGVLILPPLSLDELRRFPSPPSNLFGVLWAGGYPRIFDQGLPPNRWLNDYTTTFVQRDVRQLLNVGDLQAFTTFLRLCAGRTAREVNLSSLGSDAGVSHNTAKSWLSVLEASFICFRVPAWRHTLGKRLRKTPKLHFMDSGLACRLLDIRTREELVHHPLRGAIFESWVASEVYKAWVSRGLDPRLFHFREDRGAEIALVVEADDELLLVNTMSGATLVPEALDTLQDVAIRIAQNTSAAGRSRLVHGGGARRTRVVYGGDGSRTQRGGEIVSWSDIQDVPWV